MTEFNRKEHWEKIFETKAIEDVSWYEATPSISLELIKNIGLDKKAKIIDIGAGDSFLVDHLLELGYSNISVLDISQKAIDKAKARLGEKAHLVTWIVSDSTTFSPNETYDLWHDRASFHFLTDQSQADQYVNTAAKAVSSKGHAIIGTFSENGPTKCSGIEIKQYSKESLTEQFKNDFEVILCINVDHPTPFGTLQNFTFCTFQKLS